MIDLSERVDKLYADGGVCSVNPSPIGGTWAYCGVTVAGDRTLMASGFMACSVDHALYTNNQTEFIAAMRALGAMPVGWTGTLYTDSLVTINRLLLLARRHGAASPSIAGLPDAWVNRARRVVASLGPLQLILLQGHPTKAELAAGIGHKGLPVSEHNVWCDQACQAQAKNALGGQPRKDVIVAHVDTSLIPADFCPQCGPVVCTCPERRK